MPRFLLDNRLFLLAFALYLLGGGVLLTVLDHGEAILFFSGKRNVFGDTFFRRWTRLGEIPAYLLLIGVLLFVRRRHSILIALLGIAVALLGLGTKWLFARRRPRLFFEDVDLLDTINLADGLTIDDLYTGATSFPSGHTLSAFALYSYLAFVAREKKYTGLVLFTAAFLVAVSRVYLVQHFLEDVLVGALLGVAVGYGFYRWQARYPSGAGRWYDGGWWGTKRGA